MINFGGRIVIEPTFIGINVSNFISMIVKECLWYSSLMNVGNKVLLKLKLYQNFEFVISLAMVIY